MTVGKKSPAFLVSVWLWILLNSVNTITDQPLQLWKCEVFQLDPIDTFDIWQIFHLQNLPQPPS